LGISLAASTAAFADSSALDAYQVPAQQGSVALATGATNQQVEQARLGDGSPVYTGATAASGVDYTATASIGGQTTTQPLGASPRAL
ncbi:hypothetical protein DFR52_102680, partial [Hoeflea marina]